MGEQRLAGVPGEVGEVTEQWRKYAYAAIVEITGSLIKDDAWAVTSLHVAIEEIERAIESIEEEKEPKHGDN